MSTARTSITLPTSVSSDIIQKTQEASAIMQLARQISLPGNGLTIPVITSDPSASWVGETEAKPVSDPGLSTKIMRGYKLAVIEPFSDEFRRDYSSLYNALVQRLPGVLAAKFDNTVFGGTAAPGSDFDTFADVAQLAIDDGTDNTDVYKAFVDADTNIALAGGICNGYVLSPQGKAIVLLSRDETGRPLFLNSVAQGGMPTILGNNTAISKGAYITGEEVNVLGFAGDWTKAMYGIVSGVNITVSEEATLTVGAETINLFQNNMFAVRAEIEIGFRADTDAFNAFVQEVSSEG